MPGGSVLLQITPSEHVVLQSLAEGRSRGQVAALLELRDRELDAMLLGLFARMRVASEPEAVAAAVRRGLVDIGR